ncbi:arsenate reductase ArsC [Alpinimonas psychrophila]|uniref:Protein-tyrosine-phosphatase n=1 Tax=Alpinimonas psychrophila TaxID=748908 RepID=A0A7W3PND0_9MICO|nr:arsenate reductase ArsC [Alpinimonas psychrophila]MBA8828724.1 protein-tyrosine-phosphatase [Alpinimonas psychrophila]
MSTIEEQRGLPGLAFPEESLKRLATELATEYEGIFSAQTVGRYVLESYAARLRTSTIKAHLITTTARFVRERLTALAQTLDAAPKDVPEVLFVCVQNAGRSQMAMGLMNELAGGRVHVRSAGSMPASDISATVITAMDNIGIDITSEFPKPLTDDVVQAADVVITMGCGDACPVYPGKRYIDWNLPDPDGMSAEGVAEVREQIRVLVQQLLAELSPS